MELYGQYSRSIPQKVIINVLEILILWASFWILFQDGGAWIENSFDIRNSTHFPMRRTIIFSFSVVTFLRMAFMMIFLMKRTIPWEESLSVPFAFALYFVGFAVFALPTDKPIDLIDIFGIILFTLGSVLNTSSEILRDQWKKDPNNNGKIYTGGFFKYSRHINYFGDLLWVTAYVIITRNWFSVSILLILFSFFAFVNAPKLDKYLKAKYGEAYDDYAKKTKMLIPFLY